MWFSYYINLIINNLKPITMANSTLKLKLHKIKCIDKQEVFHDEIILWGVMVCSSFDAFMLTPEIPERRFSEGQVRKFNPAIDLITSLPFLNNELNESIVASAAVWVIERDGDNTFKEDEAYNIFSKLYLNRLTELKSENPSKKHLSLRAFKDILPTFHQKLRNAPQVHWAVNWAKDNDEIFPYIYERFSTTQFPPLTQSQQSEVIAHVQSAYGGKYEVDLSWSLEIH